MPPVMGLLDRLRVGLRRTTAQIVGRLDWMGPDAPRPAGTRALEVDTLEALEEALLMADVGVLATERILAAVEGRGTSGDNLRTIVEEEIVRIFAAAERPVATGSPRVVLVVGVNGTGKTTTVGKLAHLLRQEGRDPLICAADTFRAAAVEQLAIWAGRAGVDIVRARMGADPAAVVYDAIASARNAGRDVVLVDTAGRLHTRANLMNELSKIRRVVAREVEGAPHEVLLVLDATVGQNGLVQAREFTEVAAVTGIVLAKVDGTAKGGIAIAIAQELGLPIRYVGVGEAVEDLLPFSARDYARALFEAKW